MREQMELLYSFLYAYLELDIRTQMKLTHLNINEVDFYQKLHDEFIKKNKDKIEIQKLMTNEYKNKYKLDGFYIFCIADEVLRIAQYSNHYILDEIIYLANFFATHDLSLLKKNILKTYKIDERQKQKYINKSKRKSLETIYNNYDIGCEILDYIYDNKHMNLLGDRFGMENQVLEKLNDSDNMEAKLVLVINLDGEFVELFNSIPYELFQKGTAMLSQDGIDSCYIKDFNSQTFNDVLVN